MDKDELKRKIQMADEQIDKYREGLEGTRKLDKELVKEFAKLPQDEKEGENYVKKLQAFQKKMEESKRRRQYYQGLIDFAIEMRTMVLKQLEEAEQKENNQMRYELPKNIEESMSFAKNEEKENVSENIDDSMSLDKREQTFTGLGIPGAHGQELNENRNDNVAVPEQTFQEPWPDFNVAPRPKAPLPIQSSGGPNDIPIFPDHPLPIPPNIPPVPDYPPPSVPLIMPDGEYLPDHTRNRIIRSIIL